MPVTKKTKAGGDQKVDMAVTIYRADGGGVLASNAMEVEDEFRGFYRSSLSTGRTGAIKPPFDLRQLKRLTQESNSLGPCIDAMETNVDGTGFEVVRRDGQSLSSEDESEVDRIMAFFDEPWPGVSFTTQRRELRRDKEATGMAYLEFMRDARDQVVFCRVVESEYVRMVYLDPAIDVPVSVTRGGVTRRVTVKKRERRFAQVMGTKMVYFKEFGATRDLDKVTGEWAKKGQRLPMARRATELLQFRIMNDVDTPYAVPRWVTQIPSVLGSRKAEEHNLSFFDRGGIPPVMIVVQGGKTSSEAKQAIDEALNSKSADKVNAAVVEVVGTEGSLEGQPSPVRVTVERFGAERQSDAMFADYDEKSEMRVRRAFRLPPIFVGMASDYSFATAFASYTVAEAQVFAPERDEFDEVINLHVMPELDPTGTYVFRSMPLAVNDTAQKMTGIALAATNKAITKGTLVDAINEAVNLALVPVEDEDEAAGGEQVPEQPEPDQGGDPPTGEGQDVPGQSVPEPGGQAASPGDGTQKSDEDMVALVQRAVEVTSVPVAERDLDEWASVLAEVKKMTGPDRRAFETMLSASMAIEGKYDADGVSRVAGCALVSMLASAA